MSVLLLLLLSPLSIMLFSSSRSSRKFALLLLLMVALANSAVSVVFMSNSADGDVTVLSFVTAAAADAPSTLPPDEIYIVRVHVCHHHTCTCTYMYM